GRKIADAPQGVAERVEPRESKRADGRSKGAGERVNRSTDHGRYAHARLCSKQWSCERIDWGKRKLIVAGFESCREGSVQGRREPANLNLARDCYIGRRGRRGMVIDRLR